VLQRVTFYDMFAQYTDLVFARLPSNTLPQLSTFDLLAYWSLLPKGNIRKMSVFLYAFFFTSR